MSASRQILLVRHCQATGQAPEAALTAAGQEQAQVLARFLADQSVDHIVSSPFVRARQSVAPLATLTGLPIQLDVRLSERRLAAAPIANWRQVIHESFRDLDLRAPGGEVRSGSAGTWLGRASCPPAGRSCSACSRCARQPDQPDPAFPGPGFRLSTVGGFIQSGRVPAAGRQTGPMGVRTNLVIGTGEFCPGPALRSGHFRVAALFPAIGFLL